MASLTDSDVRPSTVEDIPEIQRIARDSWAKTYAGLISPSSQAEYLDKAYSTEWLTKLHHRPDVRGFVAMEADHPVGFAMMSLGSPADDPPGAVLRSLYLHPDTQGKGHGSSLLEAVKSAAREQGVPILWVAVHVDLADARRFYERSGFVYDGPAEVTIGSDRVRQAVYRLPLPPAETE